MSSSSSTKIRKFLPAIFTISKWESIEPYYQLLLDYEIDSADSLKLWLEKRSELECVISEEAGWRYIRMTCDTNNEEKQDSYNYFITEIEPHIQPFANQLDQKLLENKYSTQLSTTADEILIKTVKNHAAIFRKENIPLTTEIMQDQTKYGALVGGLTVTIAGEEMTMQKAGNFLFDPNREIRKNAYLEIQKKRISIKNSLNDIFDNLLKIRNEVAQNAGFDNFRDYMFVEMCRFDYSPKDCYDFHEAIAKHVVPLLNAMALERKIVLDVAELKPWDLSVDKKNRTALKPFSSGKELTDKTIECLNKIDPFIGNCIKEMEKIGHLDLESRKGKAPGGYNYPLYESGLPFIFMNSVGTVRDLVTMVHEGGHALHSILTKDLDLINYKNFPSEVAELASMSMELLSMEHWDVFFDNIEDLNRAKKDHLESIIETLPWVATIDKFQHWLYLHPTHTLEERTAMWNIIHSEFSNNILDWDELQEYKDNIWQKQLHLFEVPFYYIEYGMAQLGAIAIWKNFKENNALSLEQYLHALKLGYTQSISEIYQSAGVKFNFSASYIKELMEFVAEELKKL